MNARHTFILLALSAALAPACIADPGEDIGERGHNLSEAACDVVGEERDCVTEHYELEGVQTCSDYGDDIVEWSACESDEVPSCGAGYEWDGSCCIDETLHACCEYDEECFTPIVLSFDGAPVQYSEPSGHAFSLARHPMSMETDWPTSATPWLALDRNGDGAISEGSELFGSATPMADGTFASSGFYPLAELDDNDDGRVGPEDEAWAALRVWRDENGDRVSQASELTSLDSLGVLWLDLAFIAAPRCDDRGNCEAERASFGFADEDGVEQEGALIDVRLGAQ